MHLIVNMAERFWSQRPSASVGGEYILALTPFQVVLDFLPKPVCKQRPLDPRRRSAERGNREWVKTEYRLSYGNLVPDHCGLATEVILFSWERALPYVSDELVNDGIVDFTWIEAATRSDVRNHI